MGSANVLLASVLFTFAAQRPRAQGTRDQGHQTSFAAQVPSFQVDLVGLLDRYSAEGLLYQRQQLGGVACTRCVSAQDEFSAEPLTITFNSTWETAHHVL